MLEYTLHSKGDKWVHFRVDPNSICESFSVSYLHDNTCVMSGDYGTLVWKRYGRDKSDYGFPNEKTNIGYFAEKCRNQNQKIEEWNNEKAVDDVRETLKAYDDNVAYPQWKKDDLLEALDGLEDHDEKEMYELLRSFDPDGDWTGGRYGMVYTHQFVFQYEKLKSVSHKIVEALGKDGYADCHPDDLELVANKVI